MKRVVCSVFDSATRLFGQPFFVAARGAAMRDFGNEVNRRDGANQLHLHPEDFELWQLATFDDETGQFEDRMEVIGRAKDMVKESS